VAKTIQARKIELKEAPNILETVLLTALLNSANHGTLVEPQTVIDPKLVKDPKTSISEAFDELFFNDAKEVATAFKKPNLKNASEVGQLLVRKTNFFP
jgi:hypothetical protein